jgi:hypothetical protein
VQVQLGDVEAEPAGPLPVRVGGHLLLRSALCHPQDKDLEDLFYAEVKARNGIPASEVKVRERIAAQETTIEVLRQARGGYRAASETFAGRACAHRRERQPSQGSG